MKNISKENFKNVFKKISVIFFLLITISSFSFAFAVNSTSSNTGAPDISKINADGKGLVPACGHLAADGSAGPQCTFQDLFSMIRPIRDILLYAVIIGIVGYAAYGAVGLVFYGDVPDYREKLKKIFKNGVIALIIIVVAVSIIITALASFGFNQDVLNVLKQIFTFDNFNLIPHALAQTSTQATSSNQYIDLFPQQGLVSTIQKVIKFIVNYIVAPILTMGVIWAGFRFVKAEGNPEELASAKKFATWVFIGIVVAIATPLLLNVVLTTIQDIIG